MRGICLKNVKQRIKNHNKRVTKTKERPRLPCNCGNKNKCLMNGNLRVENKTDKKVVSASEK